MITSKKCKICKTDKPFVEFRPQKKGKYGYKSSCILCENEQNRKLYEKNKDIKKLQSAVWNENNPDKVKQYKEKWKKLQNTPDF